MGGKRLRVLITGGAGFIGKNFIRLVMSERQDWNITNLDVLTYAGNLSGLPEEGGNYRLVHADVRDTARVAEVMRHQDAVVHFAAESHVDRSILNSAEFVSANVLGTHVLLDAAHRLEVPIFVQISTDEVYGSLNPLDPAFREDTPLAPRSPYAASKAAADLLVQSYHATYGMDVRITRCSNNYGPYQFPEKLLPLAILNARRGIQIPVYGDGRQRRDWIHVEDHCRAILAVLEHGKPGQVYNVGAGQETENLAAVRSVIRLVGASEDLMTFVGDRPGHDRRYAMDARKITSELGWKPRYRFDEGLAETVAWYQANEVWWRPLLGQEYAAYYQTQYGGR